MLSSDRRPDQPYSRYARCAALLRSQASDSPQSGALHVTKECSECTSHAGSFCTVTSSNLKAIDVGSKVIDAQAAGAAGLDSDVVLYTEPGNSAFGRVSRPRLRPFLAL